MADKARTVLSVCNNMGEGWLLTAEILDLIAVRPTSSARSPSPACDLVSEDAVASVAERLVRGIKK